MSASNAPVAVVTGSRKGIGRGLAEHLLQTGFRVVGCSRNTSEFAAAHYEHVCSDVTDEAGIGELFRHLRRKYGRLDVLINNAGIATMSPALLTPSGSARAILETSMLGTFVVSREAAKVMMKHRAGRIVNLSSIAVPMRLEGESIYAAAKSAVETFTKIFAREVAPYGITVNAVGPSPIETDLTHGVPKAKLDALVDQLPIKRFATFADVANVVDFFLRPQSANITGQVIYLGGAG